MQYQKKEIQAIWVNVENRSVSRLILQKKEMPTEMLLGNGIVSFRNITIGKTRYEMWYRADATIETHCGAFRIMSSCGDLVAGNVVLFPTSPKAERIEDIDFKKKVEEIYDTIQFQKRQYNWQPLELDEEDGNPYWEKAHSARDLERK